MNEVAATLEPKAWEMPEPRQSVTPMRQAEVASPFDRLIQAATDPHTDPVKMGQLLDVAERWKAMEAKQAYAAAFAKMQADLPEIEERGEIKTQKNGPPQSTYALWEDINKAVRPVLAAHGFALSFRTSFDDASVSVTGVLTHEQGHSEETSIVLPRDKSGNKNDVQAVGSSLSYGKRYAANALLNLASRLEKDDDGEAAGLAETITPAEADNLRELLGAAGKTEASFIEYANKHYRMNMKTLDDLPAADLAGARKIILATKQKQAKAASND